MMIKKLIHNHSVYGELDGITNVRKAAKQIQTLGAESVIITGILLLSIIISSI